MEVCYLRFDKDFWGIGGKKIIYPAGTKFTYEVETMWSVDRGEIRHYYVYEKPKDNIGYYDEEEFNELFMTIDELRDRKIDEII